MSEWIIRVHTKTHFSTTIVVYISVNPTNATYDAWASSDAFYDALHSTLSTAPSCNMTIVMGDFNDSKSTQWSSVICSCGPKEHNENSVQFLNFCACRDLSISNTWLHIWSCVAPLHRRSLHYEVWNDSKEREQDCHNPEPPLQWRPLRCETVWLPNTKILFHYTDIWPPRYTKRTPA